MSIQSIIRWFEIAKPNPTLTDISVQVGCHYEEVAEMMKATSDNGLARVVDTRADDYKTVARDFYAQDKLALLDALCDQIVTALGVGYMMGFDMDKALAEVNRSNWTKFNPDGTPYIKPDGKIGKNPDTYQEPELEPYLDRKQRRKQAKQQILVERIETTTQVYEIHPEQLEQFTECDSDYLKSCFGKPCDVRYTEERSVL